MGSDFLIAGIGYNPGNFTGTLLNAGLAPRPQRINPT